MGREEGEEGLQNQRCKKMAAKPIFGTWVPKHPLEYGPSLGALIDWTHTNVHFADAVA